MRDVSIIAVGMTPFRHRPESAMEIAADGIIDALCDKELRNMDMSDMEAAYCGTMGGGPQGGQRALARLYSRMEEKGLEPQEGLTGIPVSNYENQCTSGTCAFDAAYMDIASGKHDKVLAFGFEKLGKGSLSVDSGGGLSTAKFRGPPPVPMMFAGNAKRHMKRFGTTREHLAMVAVKSKEYAATNPNAQYRQRLTIDDVLNAKMTADPLTMFMCCPTSTGGAACILAADDIAREYNELPVKIISSAMKTCRAGVSALESGWDPNIRVGYEAYKRAGISPKDIDVAQVHDCFAIAELMHYESFGWCDIGKAGEWIESGAPCKGGELPVNTDGGLISKGHPLGATGFAQIYELVHQLRGDAHNQVPDAELAWKHNMGGGVGVGMTYCVHVLGRGW
jgi:acetyl-CoA acetyltransferase